MAKMTGAQCLADMLQGYGVSHVFMVPAVLRRTFAEMEMRTRIKRIHTHGEKSAAYMADGYARASGKPGVCMAQVIGALNLAAGLRDAHLAHSPVIAFTGGRDPKTKFRKVYQEVDDVPAFEPVTKMNATVDDVSRFPDMVRQAFRVAVSGTPGPVHLQFRGNEGQVDAEEADIEPLVEEQFARVPPFRPEPDAKSVLLALAVLQAAERPVIVAGGGVRASGAGRELVTRALGGRVRHLLAGEREPRRQRGGPGVLHRHRNRRHDHAFLGGAQDRRRGDPDRQRPGSAGTQLSAQSLGAGRREGGPREDDRARRDEDRGETKALGG
jgi:acetolactate synthase-1/2/3 large subunit